MRIRWGAIGAVFTTIIGVVTDPHVVEVVKSVGITIPTLGKLAPVVALIGAVWQAATKPVVAQTPPTQ